MRPVLIALVLAAAAVPARALQNAAPPANGRTIRLAASAQTALSDLLVSQHREIDTLTAQRQDYEQLGFRNVVETYDRMIRDHRIVAARARALLAASGAPLPSPPAEMAARVEDPVRGIDMMIAMHRTALERSRANATAQPDLRVQSVFHFAASTTAKHLAWLETLRSDVAAGVRTVSDRLRTEWLASAHDEIGVAGVTTPPTVEADRVILERPAAPAAGAPALGPPRVEADRVVIERAAPAAGEAAVRGRRQVIRGRRPAK